MVAAFEKDDQPFSYPTEVPPNIELNAVVSDQTGRIRSAFLQCRGGALVCAPGGVNPFDPTDGTARGAPITVLGFDPCGRTAPRSMEAIEKTSHQPPSAQVAYERRVVRNRKFRISNVNWAGGWESDILAAACPEIGLAGRSCMVPRSNCLLTWRSHRVEGPRRPRMKRHRKYESVPERIELSSVCVTSSTTGR